MSQEEALNKFASRVENIPHIASKVLGYLDLIDTANCLRTSKALRKFVSDALINNRHLQQRLDDAVAAKYCWQSWKTSGTFSVPVDTSICSISRATMFCLDNCLWFSSRNRCFSPKSLKLATTLNIYDLDSSDNTSISVDNMPQMEVLSNGRVLVDDRLQVRVINRQGGSTDEQVVHKRPKTVKDIFASSSCMTHCQHVELIGRHCICDNVELGKEGECLTVATFNHQDGLPCQPISLHQILEDIIFNRYQYQQPDGYLVVKHKQVK